MQTTGKFHWQEQVALTEHVGFRSEKYGAVLVGWNPDLDAWFVGFKSAEDMEKFKTLDMWANHSVVKQVINIVAH